MLVLKSNFIYVFIGSYYCAYTVSCIYIDKNCVIHCHIFLIRQNFSNESTITCRGYYFASVVVNTALYTYANNSRKFVTFSKEIIFDEKFKTCLHKWQKINWMSFLQQITFSSLCRKHQISQCILWLRTEWRLHFLCIYWIKRNKRLFFQTSYKVCTI